MIYVDGFPFPSPESDPDPDPSQEEKCTLMRLLEHPFLLSASERLKSMEEKRVPVVSEGGSAELPTTYARHVFVFQREFATVNPGLVQLAGTDEATTCVGIVIRNQDSGITSIAHLDSPKVVDLGLTQMLSSLGHNEEDDLMVHLIGGFEDETESITKNAASSTDDLGYSLPLCCKIIEALEHRREHFHVRTLCVLWHNTRRNSFGNACPIISGFLVDASTGLVMPANFDMNSRSPDELVRRVRVTVSSLDPNWKGKLLDTYDIRHDRFQIAPCTWEPAWRYFAFRMMQLSDSDLLTNCSTSPSAESPDFVKNERRSAHDSGVLLQNTCLKNHFLMSSNSTTLCICVLFLWSSWHMENCCDQIIAFQFYDLKLLIIL